MISFTCLPLVFHSPNRLTCMGFLLLSKGCIPGLIILPLSPGLHPTLGALGRMSLHVSSTCLSHLSAILGALGRMSLQFTLISHTRLPYLSFTLISHSGYLGPHEFTLVFHLFPILVSHSGCLGPHEFTLVSHLSLTLVSHSGCLGPPYLSPTLGALGRMSLHLSPTLVFHTCFPLWLSWAA